MLSLRGSEYQDEGRPPNRRENEGITDRSLNKSYWFAQISASGSTSYDSTAVTLCFVGWCKVDKSKLSLHAASDASIPLSWASRTRLWSVPR